MQTSLTREVYDEIDKKFIGMSEEFGLTKGKWQLFNRESVLEALDNKT
jgi:hypothetical protein